MALLTKAVVEQSHAKIAGFGPGGSGKSLTLTLIAIALSKTYHKGAPIALFDTEKASDWLVDIYALEQVELLRVKSKSFTDMRAAHKEAIAAGCCAFNVDSYTHPWANLQATLKKQLKVDKLEFHHMQTLQEMWGEWVDEFLFSPIHCLMAGRLAYEWENDIDAETGKRGFHKAGTKLRSEKDAGYEPHLLFEMEAERVMVEERKVKVGRETKIKRREKKAGGHFIHHLHVLKDRARALNGKEFAFEDINDYKAGDWKRVFNALKPHFEKINIASGIHAPSDREHNPDEALFDGRGDGDYQRRAKRVGIVLEEIDGTLRKLWPGETAKEKALRALVIETLFETRSWKAVEGKSLEALERGLLVLHRFEHESTHDKPNALADAVELVGVLKIIKDAALVEEAAAVL
jgi:hypothetical protein